VFHWISRVKASLVGAVTGAGIGLLAFFSLTSQQYPGMGATLFILVPIGAGFAVGMVSKRSDAGFAIALLSLLASLVLLISLRREGLLCAILAFPILLAGLLIGVGLAALARRFILPCSRNQTTTLGMLLLLAPTLVLVGERLETPSLKRPRIEIVENSVQIGRSPEAVWNSILSIDSLHASKPILMYVGLPIPQRCEMVGKGVGAKRTCFFDVGSIEETITEWNPPFKMGLLIDRAHMPGRHWLAFESAQYELQAQASSTTLKRTTVVTSYLRPAWYWRFFERWGVESEHRYILNDLAMQAKR